MVHQIQQIIRDKVTAIPLFEQAFIWGVGPRVAEAGDGRIPGFSYSAPFEDLQAQIRRPGTLWRGSISSTSARR